MKTSLNFQHRLYQPKPGFEVQLTCVGPHVCAQVAGLTETLPALMAEILALSH